MEGWVHLALLVSLGWMAWSSGSLRLSVIASILGALTLLELGLGGLNLRGLQVTRRIEGEIFAEEPVQGRIVITNASGLGSVWAIRVRESSETPGEKGRSGWVLRVGRRQQQEVEVSWLFLARGEQRLKAVEVESRWPFGMVRRRRTIEVEDRVLVYPAIGSGAPTRQSGGPRQQHASSLGRGTQEGFQGLREYRRGDPMRWIHWPTSARTRRPMVVLRPDRRSDEILVEVEPHALLSWEEVLSGACGQVLRGLGSGLAVGLSLAGVVHPPRRGGAWRRHLLAELATAPEPVQESSE